MTNFEWFVNGDFEAGWTGWGRTGYTELTSYSHSGALAAHAYLPMASYDVNSSTVSQTFIEHVDLSKISTFGFWIMTSISGFDKARFIIYIYDSAGVALTPITYNLGSIGWTYFDAKALCPVGSYVGSITFQVYTDSIFEYGSGIWVDDCSLVATYGCFTSGYSIDTYWTKSWVDAPYLIDFNIQYPAVVRIDNIELDFIINFDISNINYVQLPKWINQTESMNENFYNRTSISVSYKCRVSDANKWIIDQKFRNHAFVYLKDGIHNIFSQSAWIKRVQADWTDTNWEREWIVTITLIVIL